MTHKDETLGAEARIAPTLPEEHHSTGGPSNSSPASPRSFLNSRRVPKDVRITGSEDYHAHIIEEFETQEYANFQPDTRRIDISRVFPKEIVSQYSLDLRKYTPRELLMVELYAVTLSYNQTARRCGMSISQVRSKMLDPQIKALMAARLRYVLMDVEELLARLMMIARFDFGDHLIVASEEEIKDAAEQGVRLPPVSIDWSSLTSSGDTYSLKKIKRTKFGYELEPYDKMRALDLIAKLHDLFKPAEQNITVTHTHESRLRVEELKELTDDELESFANNLSLAAGAVNDSELGEMEANTRERAVIPARVDDVTSETTSTGETV